MKSQFILFYLLLALLIIKKNYRLSVVIGLLNLFLSIPLFAFWKFYTAERLTWFAAGFFLLSVLQILIRKKS